MARVRKGLPFLDGILGVPFCGESRCMRLPIATGLFALAVLAAAETEVDMVVEGLPKLLLNFGKHVAVLIVGLTLRNLMKLY